MAREMKGSGVEWIGEIPANWLVKKIKHSFTVFAGLRLKVKNKNIGMVIFHG